MARNKKAFENAPCFPLAMAKLAINRAAEFFFLGSNKHSTSVPHQTVLDNQVPPEEGWLKLNVDGACDNSSNCITVGGLIRDHHGNWIKGFNQFMGLGNSLLSELWGALLGLKVVISLGVNCLWLQFDCLNLVNLLTHDNLNTLHQLDPIVNCYRCYLSHYNNFKISHVLREGNQRWICLLDMHSDLNVPLLALIVALLLLLQSLLQIVLVFVPLGESVDLFLEGLFCTC